MSRTRAFKSKTLLVTNNYKNCVVLLNIFLNWLFRKTYYNTIFHVHESIIFNWCCYKRCVLFLLYRSAKSKSAKKTFFHWPSTTWTGSCRLIRSIKITYSFWAPLACWSVLNFGSPTAFPSTFWFCTRTIPLLLKNCW